MKTELIPIEELETTTSIINAMEGEGALNFTTVNSLEKKCLSLMNIEYGEAGFERKSDWMRFVNKLNNYDTTPLKRIIVGDKKSLEWGEGAVSVVDIDYTGDGFEVEFKVPTQLVIEKIGDNYLVANITKLKGKVTWEWYHRNSHRDLGNYAGICEVYLHDIEILN